MTTFTVEQVREIAGQAAGAASGVFLREHPDEVMPSEEVTAAVDAVLCEFGIPARGSDLTDDELRAATLRVVAETPMLRMPELCNAIDVHAHRARRIVEHLEQRGLVYVRGLSHREGAVVVEATPLLRDLQAMGLLDPEGDAGLAIDEPVLVESGAGGLKVRMYVRLGGRVVATLGGVGLRRDSLAMLRAARDTRLRVLRGDADTLTAVFPDPDLRERIAQAASMSEREGAPCQ